jgi:hypothetical protein
VHFLSVKPFDLQVYVLFHVLLFFLLLEKPRFDVIVEALDLSASRSG